MLVRLGAVERDMCVCALVALRQLLNIGVSTMVRRVTISVFAAVTMALSMVCSAQAPNIIAEKLYDQYDQAFANHDLKQLLSMYDSGFTLIDLKGQHTGFAEFSKKQTQSFSDPQLRNFTSKTTVKDAQLKDGRLVWQGTARQGF